MKIGSLVCRSKLIPFDMSEVRNASYLAIASKIAEVIRTLFNATLAQLVERNLAKVEVTSSSLVCRSNLGF